MVVKFQLHISHSLSYIPKYPLQFLKCLYYLYEYVVLHISKKMNQSKTKGHGVYLYALQPYKLRVCFIMVYYVLFYFISHQDNILIISPTCREKLV